MSDTIPLEILIQIREELAGLNRTKAGLQETKTSAQQLGEALKQGLGIGTGMSIATGAIAAFKNTLQQTAAEAFRFAGEVKDVSAALGLSTSTYQVLRLEMENAGVEVGRLNQAIGEQIRGLAEARDATSAAAQAYSTLGLSAAEIERLPTDQRLIAVARAALEAKDQTAAFAAAANILGSRNLPQLLAALQNLGTEGTAALQKMYEAQGLIIGDRAIDRLDKAEKSWKKLWHSLVIWSGEYLANVMEVGEALKRAAGPLSQAMAGLPMSFDQRKQLFSKSWDEFIKEPGTVSAAPAVDAKTVADAQALADANKKAADAAKEHAKTAADAKAALLQAGQAIRESVLEPYEKYDAAMASLREQLAGGAIDQVTYARAAEKARDALQEVTGAIDPATEALRRQGQAVEQSVMTPLERYAERVAELDALHQAGAISAETYARAMKDAYEKLEKSKVDPWSRTAEDVADGVRSMTYSISDAIVGLQSWGDAWKSLGNIALKMLSKIIAEMLVAQAVSGFLTILGTAIGGPVGGFIGNVAGRVISGGGGTFMTNGPTQFTVGDNPGGKELVSVIPISGVGQTSINGRALAMAGGGNAIVNGLGSNAAPVINVHQVLNVATGVASTVRSEIMSMMPMLRELAVDSTREAMVRGDL